MIDPVFSVQDATGSVQQLEIADHPTTEIAAGDTGTLADILFTVTDVVSTVQFSVSTNGEDTDFPATGTITWLTGANATTTSDVIEKDGANAYMTVAQFKAYHDARGNSYAGSPEEAVRFAIVKATDYLDQKYRYKGVKKVSVIANLVDPNLAFIDPFLSPFGVGTIPFLSSSTSSQSTEWPRQGVTDNNGNLVVGIPKQIIWACAELANRVLNDTDLQPDYDGDLINNGGVVQAISEEVGPIKTSRTFDTRLGLGFFPSFPHIDRMLAKAGILMAGGGRTVLR
jgi:hypothetical protein